MFKPRIIPVLLLKDLGLYKGIKFKDFRYVGDPINAVKIFNDKEVDELFFLDVIASKNNTLISLDMVRNVADECFMPFGVGGGITSSEEAKTLINAGAEKISINSSAVNNPGLISLISQSFGSQSVVVSIDYKRTITGKYYVFTVSGSEKNSINPLDWAKEVEKLGAGEILLTSIDRDGTMNGMDLEMIKKVSGCINIPLIACGGAGNLHHVRNAVSAGASAVAAGSMFVFYTAKRGVLINYPDKDEIKEFF